MANYESALTGQQMDAALTEVALYNPEAWAVGQRNGVPVTSADETWHNNAKYYAQVAQSAIPGTYTAAVRWDIAQGLAGEAQEQARANISAGASNRNLLDNPFFSVNQRGFTRVTDGNNAPLVDRWKAYRASVVLNTDNSMTVTPTSEQYGIAQFIEASRLKVGQTYTMSALVNGEILSASFVYSTTPASSYFATFPNGIRFYRHYANGILDFWVIRSTTEAFVVQAVKLERGAYSTLANDDIPNKRAVLADCQARFLLVKSETTVGVVGFGSQTQSDRAYILIPTPVTMELNANNTMSVSLTGTARLVGNGSGSINVTSVSFVSREANGVLIACFGSNIAANVTYNLYLTSGSYIDISGDL